MTEELAAAHKLLRKRLHFGNDDQIKAYHFILRVEECAEAWDACPHRKSHCQMCRGDGECPHCEQVCPKCEGAGWCGSKMCTCLGDFTAQEIAAAEDIRKSRHPRKKTQEEPLLWT